MSYADELLKVKRRIRSLEKRGYSFDGLDGLYSDGNLILPTDVDELSEYTIDYLYSIAEYTPSTKVKEYLARQGIEIDKDEVLTGEEGREYERQLRTENLYRTNTKRKRKRERELREEDLSRTLGEISEDEELTTIVKGEYILNEIEQMLTQLDFGDVYSEAKEIDPNIKVNNYYVDTYKKGHQLNLINELNNLIAELGEEEVAKKLEQNASTIQESVRLILYGSGGENGDAKINQEIVKFVQLIRGGALSPRENEALTQSIDSEYYYE